MNEALYSKITFFGINRNIVECKQHFLYKQDDYYFELIETLWNVNIVMSGRSSTEVSELIETLWNVNDIIGVQKMVTRPGINRNIVECKF